MEAQRGIHTVEYYTPIQKEKALIPEESGAMTPLYSCVE